MKPNEMLNVLLAREGNKFGINRGQMKEILGIVADVVMENPVGGFRCLTKLGEDRQKRKIAKAKQGGKPARA